MPVINLCETLRVFRKVVEVESFTAAARELGISVTWAAKSVDRLEAHLGVTLLQRTTRRIHVTEAGRQCYESAGQIIDDIDELEASLSEAAIVPKGKVRISAPVSLAICELGPLIGEFCKTYPEIDLDLVLSDRFVDVVEEGFDLAIRLAAGLSDSGFLVRKLGPVQRIACAAPSYLQVRGQPNTPEDLLHHDCLVFSLLTVQNTWQFSRDENETSIRPHRKIAANNSLLLRSALLEGVGIALIPEFIVRDDLSAGRLAQVLPLYSPEPFNLYLIRPHDRRQPHRVSLFADFLVARLPCLRSRQPELTQSN